MYQSAGRALCFSPGGRGGGANAPQGPHFFLLPSAPWGYRHLGRSALYCCPPALNTPDPNTSTTGGSGAGRRAGTGKLLRERFNWNPVNCAQFSLLPTTEYMGHRVEGATGHGTCPSVPPTHTYKAELSRNTGKQGDCPGQERRQSGEKGLEAETPPWCGGKTGTTATLVQLERVPRVRDGDGRGRLSRTSLGATPGSPGNGPSRSKRGPRAEALSHPPPSALPNAVTVSPLTPKWATAASESVPSSNS